MDPYFAILSERNNAVRELNMVIAEKRQAIADREMAIQQRDAAVADRDHARMQRDNAIAQLQMKTISMNPTQLQMKTVSMNPSSVIQNPSESGVSVSQGTKQIQMLPQQQQQRRYHMVNYSEVAFKPLEVPFSDVFTQSTTTALKTMKSKKGNRARETKTVSSVKALKPARKTKAVSSNKALKPAREAKTVSSTTALKPASVTKTVSSTMALKPAGETKTVSINKDLKPTRETKTVSSNKALKPARKISKKGTRNSDKQLIVPPHASSDNGTSEKGGNLEKQIVLKGGLSLNELGLDYANLPVPFCSCTGNPQSCYKWGKGGWQSACCTTSLSMYPLPQIPNKRHSRMGGRKMSGGAFTKLIIRLASEGHDITVPIDLKNHWAKHGTNRYIIIR
ncbi:hypothetical protein QQ045_010865 [Rhodiola kirilowii]